MLGKNGRQFFRQHYDWPVIERKYLDLFDRLSRESAPRQMEPLPGWFERRRQDVPPAESVLAKLPKGPSLATARQQGAAERRAYAVAPAPALGRPAETRSRQSAQHRGRHARVTRRGGSQE